MVIVYSIALFFIFCFLAGLFIHLFDVAFVGHDFATTILAANKVSQIIKDYKKDEALVYDLGSSRGGFITDLLIHSPKITVIGVDSSKLRIFTSRFRNFFRNQQVKFLKANIFSVNISRADVVYIYLKPSLMPDLEAKLKQELKSGAIVILNTQTFPSWTLDSSYITHLKKPEYEKLSVYLQPWIKKSFKLNII